MASDARTSRKLRQCAGTLGAADRLRASFPADEAAAAIPDRFPGPWLVNWEYRQDSIILLGSTVSDDLRIRYQAQLGAIAPATAENPLSNVSIAILCSINALATLVAYTYARALGAPAAQTMQTDAEALVRLITNRYTRQNQHVPRRRRGFGNKNIGRVNLPW